MKNKSSCRKKNHKRFTSFQLFPVLINHMLITIKSNYTTELKAPNTNMNVT